MPIYEAECHDCGQVSEVLAASVDEKLTCPNCGGQKMEKLMSAPSGLTGKTPSRFPGPGDTSCCGSTPAAAGCQGPGSCCGKMG